MSLESGSYIKDLVQTNPEGTDPKSQGDDHLRLLKAVLKTQFAGFTQGKPITRTEDQINAMLLAGAFGLGGPAIAFTDANAVGLLQQTGFYYYAGGGFNFPSGANNGDTLLNIYVNATVSTQLWHRLTDDVVLTRHFLISAWSAWKPLVQGIKQSSFLDSTAGSVLTVGAFGLGNQGGNSGATNLDAAPAFTHWIGINAGMTGTLPPGSNVGDMCLNTCHSSAGSFQLYFVQSTKTTWYRQKNAAVLSPWTCLTPLGVEQTWQQLNTSRAFNTTYTNSTGRPIQVIVTGLGAANIAQFMEVQVGGVVLGRAAVTESNGGSWPAMRNTLNFTVPAGLGYAVGLGGAGSVDSWAELR